MRILKKTLGIGVLVIFLILVRMFEKALFYDPLIEFYQRDYLHHQIPEFNFWLLLLNLVLRFLLNTVISLAILYIAFFNKNIVRFASLLYLILLLIGGSVFIFLLLNIENEHFLALFYVRRFLIHPIFILILLPAFHYYRLRSLYSLQNKNISEEI
ncbi:exosortase F system-associated membrane protein [Autumnicola musiva]|uniref:Exosortase F system-associated protein n=1 Tax=Autumnicola musiva TaxID=3075589 RepID=A0ABU3D0B9_9FLAO|nr:exosortase F system-associated protein [Zunongwangia sp. F117]MDT0674984.1 exosortase F system-associated protein [Zunongwangia sp. F117]